MHLTATYRSAIRTARDVVSDIGEEAAAASGGLVELAAISENRSERDGSRLMGRKAGLSLQVPLSMLGEKDLAFPILKLRDWGQFTSQCLPSQAIGPGFIDVALLRGVPWETIHERDPLWLKTVFSESGFAHVPAVARLLAVPGQEEAILAYDLFHAFHLGVGKHFLGSCLALWSSHFPGGNVDKRFEGLESSFFTWCKANREVPVLTRLTKETIQWPSTFDYPAGSWFKGSVTTVLFKFLQATMCQQNWAHEPMLAKAAEAVQSINRFFSALYASDLYLEPGRAIEIAEDGLRFMRRLAWLAKQATKDERALWYAQRRDPLKWTTDHFALLFQAAAEDQVPVHWEQEGCDGVPFQVEELREVVNKGRNGRAVGLDLTSYELVKELCKNTTSEGSLLAWMESIRMGAPVPEEWLTTIITLLPKKPKPESPSDLRPISLSSAVSKVYGGLLLNRTRRALQPQGPEQCALGGRQTSDYLFAVMRTFSLETEWRFGLSWLKLDISKAYDSIHRWKILEYLRGNLPPSMWREFESWKQLLEPGRAQVRTPWGSAYISQTKGIRQGSVESPFIFAVAMECALRRAQSAEGWPRVLGGAPDMALSSLLYMDDSILWDTSRESLERKFTILSKELKQWGLKVNPKKTVFYSSPHAPSLPQIRLDGVVVQSSDALEVMGVRFAVPFKPAAIMDTGMAKARKKYFASREVLECRGPLKKRLQVFRTAVGGAALWYASAAPPNFQAMGALNTMQLEFVARMAGHKRRPDESWLDFRMRSLRAARQILSNAGMERWSTTWLRRHWQYRGHVVRAASRDQPPASSVMDGYRTLPWWRRQQASRDGVRHPAAFFPHLSNEEVRLNRAAGRAEWRELAADPVEWKKKEDQWVRQNDIAWCSGRQLTLTG
ncbi:unnamed protein product [Symbiodinium necroappetens]|uniref:Reverse transcriptase domain-containing protein n=1 Tax=Symbiodinium necroappetens TaxID=1628268 RepID=A0A812U130_9DINO|nr:unnamed protein product [Symbiodinium necroappetens]